MIATVGRVELGDAFEGGVGVVQVVVRQFLALELGRGGDAGTPRRRRRTPRAGAGSRHSAGLAQRAGDCSASGKRSPALVGEPGRDRRVVGRGAREGVGLAARRRSASVVPPRAPPSRRAPPRIAPGRSATVTKSWFLAAARISAGPPMSMFSTHSSNPRAARPRRLEGIEIHRHQIDGRDPVPGDGVEMRLLIAPGEDAAVNSRMQRLHPPVEHLGEAGDRSHIRDRDARPRRAPWPCRRSK